MGVRLIVPGVTFTNYAEIVAYPVPDDLSSLFYLGASEAATEVNHAVPDGSAPGVITGSVTYSSHYAIFTGASTNNYMLTEETDATADASYIAVFRMPNAVAGAPPGRGIFSCFGGGGGGASMFHDGLFADSDGGGSVYPKFTGVSGAASQADFYFRAGVLSGTSVIAYRVLGGAVVAGQTLTNTRATASRAMRIGGHASVTGGYLDTAHIALASKHGSALSVPQLQSIYDYVRAYYARRGLTVI